MRVYLGPTFVPMLNTHTQTHTHSPNTHTHIYIYIYIYSLYLLILLMFTGDIQESVLTDYRKSSPPKYGLPPNISKDDLSTPR